MRDDALSPHRRIDRRTAGGLAVWVATFLLAASAGPARAESEIFVAEHGVRVFSRTADGNVVPLRHLKHLTAQSAGGVAVDPVNHEVFVTDSGADAIHVYARTANGNAAPIRSIQGPLTQIRNPFGMFVDTVHDELVVAESGNDLVLVFQRTANGNVAPIRKIQNHEQNATGLFAHLAVFVDLVHDELLVSATRLATDVIAVFPRTANGVNVPALREISGGFNSFLEGLFVNVATDEIIAASTQQAGEIRVYPRTASSGLSNPTPFPPKRTIAGPATGLLKPVGLDVDPASGEIIVTSANNASIRTFPLSGSGNIAPTRVIAGLGTGLDNPQLMALGAVPAGLPAPLLAAVLPAGRSVRTGTAATAFATLLNTGPTTLSNCEIAPLNGPVSDLQHTYTSQITNPATNQLTGTPDTPVSIPANSFQTFFLAFTPASSFPPIEMQLAFQCAGAALAPITTGLTTLLLSASATAIPDIVALAATAGNNGIVDIAAATEGGAFAVATVNVAAPGLITVTADTGGATLPVNLSLCQTNPVTGQCTSAIGSSVTVQIDANQTPTFAVFVQGTGPFPFDPAGSRVFVRFKDAGGVVRGATSVAPRTI